MDDVVLVDPGDREWPVGLNLLECAGDDERDFVCGEFLLMIRKLWDPRLQEPMAFGPVYEQAMRAAVRTAMLFPDGGTVVDIPRLFEDQRFRDHCLEQIDEPALHAYWNVTWKQTDRGDMRPYITSKVDVLRQNRTLRRIVGQPRSTVNVGTLMNGGKIVLLNLSLGRLGAADAGLLGSILVTKVFAAAMARTALPPERRRFFALYIDEFQAFSTDTIGSLISAARKYAVSVTLSHQNLSQLTPAIRDEVLGNVGNILCFRPGPMDVDHLQRYFHPAFSPAELLTLPNWVAAARLVGPCGTLAPFAFATSPVAGLPDRSVGETIRERSRARFARPRAEVDADLHERMTGPVPPARTQ